MSPPRTWYTSDQHFFHANIIPLCGRPFTTIEEHNDALVELWNGVVGERDTVWVVGDVALSPKGLGPVAQLKGHKVLVAGNHDSCWEKHKRWRGQVQRYLDAGFERVITSGVVNMHQLPGGITVRISHLPYRGDSHDEDRYADRRPVDDGLPLICGHVHTAWKTRGKMLNVGVDQWHFQPVPQELVEVEVQGMYRIGA